MVAALLCPSCQPSTLMPDITPSHCYGNGDRPALPGVLGGNRCPCPCRPAPRATAKGAATWRCATVGCGHETGVWAEVERHSHGLGHARVEQVLS